MSDLQILLIGIGCAIAFSLYLVLCDRVRG
jgi:hypothetical protein